MWQKQNPALTKNFSQIGAVAPKICPPFSLSNPKVAKNLRKNNQKTLYYLVFLQVFHLRPDQLERGLFTRIQKKVQL